MENVLDQVSKPLSKANENLGHAGRSVGGWLKFFCYSLIYLTPLFTIASLVRGFETTKTLTATYPSLAAPIWLEWIVKLFVVIYGIVIGHRMLRGGRNGKREARKYLWTRLVASLAIGVAWKFAIQELPAGLSESAFMQVNAAFLAELLIFGVWMIYFNKSKRVKVTYSGEE